MRVLITRPEREATALAAALSQRGHTPVIAPLFRLQIIRPPADFAPRLAACQAVLLTSANGARALAEASEQRSKPILAVGDTTAATAEGLGFTSVISASGDGAALGELAAKRLDPAAGPLLHVAGMDVSNTLALDGFKLDRVPLYDARAEESLPPSAQAALQARAIDAATFFSPRASETFAKLVAAANLADTCRGVTAIAISAAAAKPLSNVPFKTVATAARPTRQAVLDEIDRLAKVDVKEAVPPRSTMSDAPPSEPLRLTTPAPEPSLEPAPTSHPAPVVRGGIGIVGAFVTGLIAAAIVLAAAVASLPQWPADLRAMWRGPAPTPVVTPAPAAPVIDTAAVDSAKRELAQRIDDLDKRVRGLANTAAQSAPAAPATTSESDIAPLRARIESLESKPAPPPAPVDDKETAALRLEIATLRNSLQAIEQSVSGQKDKVSTLEVAVEKSQAQSSKASSGEQKALAAARASTAIGIAARLSAALDSNRPFASDVALLAPLAQDDKKVADLVAALQPLAQSGVASRATLEAEFPAVAKGAMADDLADDSFGERVLGKIKALVSLRRVGADVTGDTVEAKLARAEAALAAGDLGKAVEIVKSLPPQVGRAIGPWLARAEAHLAAQQSIDQLAAYAVGLLGQARQQ